MGEEIIYLDHAAATPLDSRVVAAMQPYFTEVFYNPSASYTGGRAAKLVLETARRDCAAVLGAKADEIIFTAGATESVAMALRGILIGGGHAVIGATEHAAVRAAVKEFPHSFAAADIRGVISPEAVREALTDTTVVVSVALADSEFGTVQPLRDIASVLESVRSERRTAGNTTPLWLHSDASQAAISLDLKVSRLGVDMLTLNAAKCYGPKQMGLLWTKPAVVLAPFLGGGGQERGLRSGTENVAAAVGFARALELVQKGRQTENERLLSLRAVLAYELTNNIENLVIDGNPKKHLAGHLHIHIAGLDAERVIFHLDNVGVYAATGAACAANKATRSPALEAVGMSSEEADGSLRFTLGKLNNEDQIRRVIPLIITAIQTERQL